jgi:hypothetical protein
MNASDHVGHRYACVGPRRVLRPRGGRRPLPRFHAPRGDVAGVPQWQSRDSHPIGPGSSLAQVLPAGPAGTAAVDDRLS